ncbi:MAG: hypothetical protein EOP05_11845 [Proteobacteria bacterium]|nr:MAG: hypothetical protein EOP05_11845 [Pseudomonadota bacterium]
MKLFAKSLATLLLVILASVFLNQEHAFALGKPTVLHISFIDNSAFTSSAIAETDRFLKLAIPGAKLISVKAYVPRFSADPEELRTSIQKQIRKRVKSSDLITHLVIDTHGNTLAPKLDLNDPDIEAKKAAYALKTAEEQNAEKLTILSHIGEVSRTAADQDFRVFFKLIKGQFADDATVILNSCLTLCGDGEAPAERAKQFLKELGIPNGQIYGAVVPEVDSPGSYVKKGAIKRALTDWAQLKLFATIGVALGLPLAVVQYWGDPVGMAQSGLLISAGTAALLHVTMPLVKRLAASLPDYNHGRLFIFKNGRKTSEANVRKYNDKLLIYGASCSAAFTSF